MTKKLFATILLFLATFLCFSLAAYADMGAKPSITVHVENAPEQYYIALLHDWQHEDSDSNNYKLGLIINDMTVRQYLENLDYEGWSLFQSPVGDNIYQSNEDHTYVFSYMVPNPFRVIIVSMDGDVVVSEPCSQKEFNAKCTFDYGSGVIVEKRVGRMLLRIFIIILLFSLTLVFEYAVLLLFGYPRTKGNITCLLIVNAITNLPLNILLMSIPAGLAVFVVTILAEIVITLFEAIVYACTLKNVDGEKKPLKGFFYGICANIVSAFMGIVLYTLLSGFMFS